MIRILIIDAVKLVGHLMASALKEEADMEVVGVVSSPKEAEPRLSEMDVVLVSASLPEDEALNLTRAVEQGEDATAIVVVGVNESHESILNYIECGASGYVLHDSGVDELVRNIRAAAQGRALVDDEMAATLMERITTLARCRPSRVPSRVHDLTPRECEVLQHVAQGLTNKQIAERLYIELGTVKNHVHSILRKLEVGSREAAAPYAEHLSRDEV